MNAKQTTSTPNDWVRCQSKSRADRYYMFNKKTGDTKWCSEFDKIVPQKTVTTKDILKTPAQDRLKRLQNTLHKARQKDSTVKRNEQNKKVDLSEVEKKPLESNSCSSVLKISNLDDILKKGTVEVKQTYAEKQISGSPKQKIVQNEAENKIKPNKKKNKNSSQVDYEKVPEVKTENFKVDNKQKRVAKEHTFIIPKKKAKMPEENISPIRNTSTSLTHENKITSEVVKLEESNISNKSESLAMVATSLPKTKKDNAFDNKKDISAEIFPSNQEKNNTPESAKLEVKLPSSSSPVHTNQKFNFITKIKDFYNDLFTKVTPSKKWKPPINNEIKKQTKLLNNSKSIFKPKKPSEKNFACSVLQKHENLISKEQSLIKTTSSTSLIPPVLPTSANDRLQRLRNSLQQQQTNIHLRTPPIYPLHASSESLKSSATSPESEPMDWQPILEEDYLKSDTNVPFLKDVKSPDSSSLSEHYDTVNENLLRLADKTKQNNQWKYDHFYFVVDTNVFIQNLTFVEELSTMKLCDTTGTIIFVPYCVLQELDKLKIRSPSESIKLRSSRAIKYLNRAFDNKIEWIQVQSAADENKFLIKVTSPDDSILNCCLQIKRHIDNVLLLTEDINLQNKAMSNNILVSTKSDLVSKHESNIEENDTTKIKRAFPGKSD